MKYPIITLSILGLIALTGCDSSSRKRSAVAGLNAPPAIAEVKLSPEEAAKKRKQNPSGPNPDLIQRKPNNSGTGDETPKSVDDGANDGSIKPNAGNPDANPNGTRVKAGPELGNKDFGPLGQSFEVYFGAKARIEFLKMQHAMDLFKIEHGLPKSHEEFMEKIVKENSVKLPELPEGNVYEYDPKTGDLMVAPAKDK